MKRSEEEEYKKLLARIHQAKKQLGLDDDAYRFHIAAMTNGKHRSCKGLSNALLRRIASSLEGYLRGDTRKVAGKGKIPPKKEKTLRYDDLGERPGMATPKQLRYLEVLWAQVSTSQDRDSALRKWLFNQFQVSGMRFLNAETVKKAIKILNGWIGGKNGKKGGQTGSTGI